MDYPKNAEFEIEGLKMSVKTYLTISEIEMIVQNVVGIESLAQRRMVKEMLVLSICTDINLEENDYDMLCANGIVNIVMNSITNINVLNDIVKEECSITRVVERVLSQVNEKLPKDVNKAVKSWIKEMAKLKDTK